MELRFWMERYLEKKNPLVLVLGASIVNIRKTVHVLLTIPPFPSLRITSMQRTIPYLTYQPRYLPNNLLTKHKTYACSIDQMAIHPSIHT